MAPRNPKLVRSDEVEHKVRLRVCAEDNSAESQMSSDNTLMPHKQSTYFDFYSTLC